MLSTFSSFCTATKIPFMYSFSARPQSQFPHSCVCERFIYSQDPQDRSTYLAAAKQTDRSWKYINLSQKYECRNWERDHYNSVCEISRLHTAQLHFWKYINGNQTFIFDSHQPFICSVYLRVVRHVTGNDQDYLGESPEWLFRYLHFSKRATVGVLAPM